MAKKCPPGKYYCFDDKKCKKIPRGYHIGARGYLARDDDNETKKNGNGNSNGNGNGGNGAGNGNGGSGGGANGNGGGMGEEVIYEILDKKDVPHVKKLVKKLRAGSKTHAKQADDLEVAMKEESNPRVPRKKGQPAKSKKHSDLYTDEDPKGTIHGLGFKDVSKAKASVSKIRNSSRSHAHKIQAAVAMEQRAREMGKTSEAAVYRKYINSMKKKTKKMNEGMYNHPEFALITVAVDELEKGLMDLQGITYDSVDKLMQGIAKRNSISPTLLHNQFKAKHLTIPDDWAIRYRMNKMKGIEEATMTPAQKRKDTMLKKKYDKSDMKKSMQKQYGKEEGKKVYFATIRKQAMGEMALNPDNPNRGRAFRKKKFLEKQLKDTPSQRTGGETVDKSNLDTSRIDVNKGKTPKRQTFNKPTSLKPENEFHSENHKYNVSEEGLRDWFGKSSGTTKSGRKVRGWVQVGGKYDGKPCARQPGQKSTPKCVSSSKRRSMSKSERDSAARRKRAADPNQPQKSGAAKPTNVSTDPKRKMKENYFNRNKVIEGFNDPADVTGLPDSVGKRNLQGKESESSKKLRKDSNKTRLEMDKNNPKVTSSESVNNIKEAKDKKGKGSGTKDACYHKVKSRYSVWPSAYASGALVKCRKVGAANWGNKSKNEGFSPMQVAALEAAGMIDIKEGQKCWKGYEKKGTKMMFGKRYNNCVKKKTTSESAGLPDFKDKLNQQSAARNEVKKKLDDLKQSQSGTPQNPEVTKVTKEKNKNMRNVTSKMQRVGDAVKRVGKSIFGKEEYAPVTEGITFKRGKKKSKSKYVGEYDAGRAAKRVMAKKDQETVNFLEPAYESKTRLVKNGHTYKVILTWRGKTYMVQMFVPSVSRPTRQQVEKEVQKIYPDAKLMSFLPRDLEPGEPTVMMGEEKRDEYGDIVGGPKISKKKKAKNLAKNEPDEQHTTTTSEAYSSKPSNIKKKAKLTAALNRLQDLKVKQKMSEEQDPEGMKLSDVQRIKRQKQLSDAAKKAPEVKNKIVPIKTSTTEEVIHEDDMKGMSVKSGHKRPTKSGAGMTAKGVAAYRRKNPGSKLQTAVTGKVKKGSKDAKRRKSYCARSAGQMKKFPKAAKDPNSRLRQARRRWKC